MRTRKMLVALTMVAACGEVGGPVLYPSKDGAVGGNPSGTGGSMVGTGGLAVGTGGVIVGTGGAVVGTGGSVVSRGGAIGTGGSVIATGGINLGTGGRATSPGGAGGTTPGSGGATVGTGGSAIGRGGATGTGGSVLGTGGANLGNGGTAGGRGGSGASNPDAGTPCSSWTTAEDCRNAGCTPVNGIRDGISEISTFFECIDGSCPAVVTAAYPPGDPGTCYMFFSGCVPTGWTTFTGGTCPTTALMPTIAAVSVGLDCMPGTPSTTDRLHVSFDVKYENNTAGSTPGLATITSAALSFPDSTIQSIPFEVIPADSGLVEAGKSVVVSHQKDPNSSSGLGCPCTSSLSVMLDLTWRTGGQVGGKTVSSSFGPVTLGCAY